MESLPNLDYVIDGVYISGVRAMYSIGAMRDANIRHVLKLYYYEPYWPDDFVVCENPVIDGQRVPDEALKRGVDFINEQVQAKRPVLVQCGAGISRSSTFVLAYMIGAGHDLHDAFELLKAKHSPSWPLPAMWNTLIEYYDLSYSLNEVLRWVTNRAPD